MKIKFAEPPNYAEIVARFGPLRPHVLFAYGDVIYTRLPRQEFDLGLIRHETVHSQQQKRHGGPAAWWRRYLDDPDFRKEQEIEAYRAQLAFYRLKLPRKVMRQVEIAVSKELCGPMYGRMMTRQDAMRVLTEPGWKPGPAALPAFEEEPDVPAMLASEAERFEQQLDDQDRWWIKLVGGVRKAVLR